MTKQDYLLDDEPEPTRVEKPPIVYVNTLVIGLAVGIVAVVIGRMVIQIVLLWLAKAGA